MEQGRSKQESIRRQRDRLELIIHPEEELPDDGGNAPPDRSGHPEVRHTPENEDGAGVGPIPDRTRPAKRKRSPPGNDRDRDDLR